MSAAAGLPAPQRSLGPLQRRRLIVANGVLLLVEALHDLDHVRQTYYLCFSASPMVWATLMFGFLPNIAAIWMSRKGNIYAAHLTIFSAFSLSVTLLCVHLFGGPSFFGGFAVPYTRSGVDLLSWAMLWALLMACIYACTVGASVIARNKKTSCSP